MSDKQTRDADAMRDRRALERELLTADQERAREQQIPDEDVSAAWDRYVEESKGAERESIRESAAWHRYMTVLRKWRNQR